MTLISVVLPEPFGPTRPTTSPLATARFTPRSAWMPPNARHTLRHSRRGAMGDESADGPGESRGAMAGAWADMPGEGGACTAGSGGAIGAEVGLSRSEERRGGRE